MQVTVLVSTLLGIGVVSIAFAYVALNANRATEQAFPQIAQSAYSIRRWWMVLLCLLGSIMTWLTLSPFPISATSTTAPRVISATGGQWYWKLDSNTATVGKPVQFHVTSVDVNHSFAIYDTDNQIVTQTQAMPGFINKLNFTFVKPGKYRVLCLEYCGVAHRGMVAEIIVSEEK